LAYARLAQYAGKDGECFPKQATLATELGVSERTANEYVRNLVRHKLIEMERPGLGISNRYFFLDHPWIYEDQPDTAPNSCQERQNSSAPEQRNASDQGRQEASVPITKENQLKRESVKKQLTHELATSGLPQTVEEAIATASQLGIEEEFAKQEFHAKKSIGWKDGYGNSINSWPDHLQARWPVELRKRAERRSESRTSMKRLQPPRQFHPGDYQQPVKDF
jgi:DNA-binding transcriptional regulator YhcF (GntR family)